MSRFHPDDDDNDDDAARSVASRVWQPGDLYRNSNQMIMMSLTCNNKGFGLGLRTTHWSLTTTTATNNMRFVTHVGVVIAVNHNKASFERKL